MLCWEKTVEFPHSFPMRGTHLQLFLHGQIMCAWIMAPSIRNNEGTQPMRNLLLRRCLNPSTRKKKYSTVCYNARGELPMHHQFACRKCGCVFEGTLVSSGTLNSLRNKLRFHITTAGNNTSFQFGSQKGLKKRLIQF